MRSPLRRIAPLAALVLLNAAAHFLPPERASVGPDDYSYLVRFGSAPFADIARLFVTERQRPLQLVALALQARLVGGGPTGALLLPFLSSTALLLSAYALFRALTQKDVAAFLAAAAFTLLPQTGEVYHTAMYFNVNVALSLWLLCATFFLRFLQGGGALRLAASLVLYAVAVFWYEVGFFVPAVFAVWGFLLHRGRARHAVWFGPIAVLYFVYGHTTLLGVAPGAYGHAVGWDAKPLLHLLSFAAGPHALRGIVYGFYCFSQIAPGWLAVIAAVDAALAYALWRWLRTVDLVFDRRAVTLAGLLALGFLLPFAAQAKGGIAGRHLIVPSVAFVLVVVAWVARVRAGRSVIAVALGLGLIVAQGNAWAHVVACRINGAVYEALRSRGPALRAASDVVIDVHSLTERIPFTWVPAEFDQLNGYYGAQALEEWGLIMMARLASGDANKWVRLAVGPLESDGASWRFVQGQHTGSRAFTKEIVTVPKAGTVVIGFAQIFGREFRDGRGAF